MKTVVERWWGAMSDSSPLRDSLFVCPCLILHQGGAWVGYGALSGQSEIPLDYVIDTFRQRPDYTLLFANQEDLETFLADPTVAEEVRTYLQAVRELPQSIDALTLEEFLELIQQDCYGPQLPQDAWQNPKEALAALMKEPVHLHDPAASKSALFEGQGIGPRSAAMTNPLMMFHVLRVMSDRELSLFPDAAIAEGFFDPGEINLTWDEGFVDTPTINYRGPLLVRASPPNSGFLRGWSAGADLEFETHIGDALPTGLVTIIETPRVPELKFLTIDKTRELQRRTVPLDVLAAARA